MTLPTRLLVLHLGSIGDVVDALVLAAAVKDAHPETHVSWVAHTTTAPLVEGHPCIDRVHVWKSGGGLSEFTRLVGELRGERHELAVDLQRTQRSALLARLSGAERVVGHERGRAREVSWLWKTRRASEGGPSVHRVERCLAIAEYIGFPTRTARHELPREAAADAWAEERVRALGGKPILVNVGASKPENRWAPERFETFARTLADEQALPVCLTGGPADWAHLVAGVVIRPNVHDLVGALELPQFVALARRARLFVGGDTGPLHVAAAVGTPAVALFGRADPARTGPWGTGHRVLRSPAHRMEDITVEQVLAATREQLGLVHA